MKEVLLAMADYNEKAGKALCALLESLPEPVHSELPSKDAGVYFKSINGIMEHVAWAMALWLQRFASFGDYACLRKHTLVTSDLAALRESIRGQPNKTAALMHEAAGLIREFVAGLSDAELGRTVNYKATDGTPFTRTLWHTVMQVLNHGTHHRGEISAILDQNGIDNDLNSFISYMY